METFEENEAETAVIVAETSNAVMETSKLIKRFGPTIPTDVIQDIISRLPVKFLLRFKCLSKMWCSIIQSPLFATAYLTRTLSSPQDRCALLFVARDRSTSQCHFLSGSHFGGSTTYLFTLSNIPTQANSVDHVSGLILFHTENGYITYNFAYIINPSTYEVFKLPGRSAQPKFSYRNAYICYFLGHDPSTNQFKVLNTRTIGLNTPKKLKVECGIFNVSTCTWKRIDPSVFPFDLKGDDWLGWSSGSVCINGVIYMILSDSRVVAAFDLREEKFSLIPLPEGVVISHSLSSGPEGDPALYASDPYLINYNGFLAVVCYEEIFLENLVELWILADSDNQFWVKEIIDLPVDWEGTRNHLPEAGTWMGELRFSSKPMSRGCMEIPFYCAKQRSFRLAEFTFPEWLESEDVQFSCCGEYVQSILHIRRNH